MSDAQTVNVGCGRRLNAPAAGATPYSIATDIVSVFTLTISSIGFAISLAVLIFGGPLEGGMSRAIGSFVIGGGVMAVVVARRSRIVPVATFVQDGPAIMMAAVVAGFVAREGAEVADVFVLMVVTMVAAALVTGLLGHFGLGALGRYLPTLVVGAFVGGTGWLLFKGGIDVMTGDSLGVADLGGLFGFEVAKFWVPGLVIGLVAWLAGRSQRVPGYALGIIIGACLAGFYLVVGLTSSVPAVESGGWLLGPFPETGGSRFVTLGEFRAADWAGIARTAPGIASVVGLTCVAQLLHLTGIRAELAPQLDINAELRTGAGANLAAAFFGVTPGFQGLGYTVLLHRLGATRRAVALVSGGLVIAFGFVGVTAVGYVPRFVVGALLVMIGVALLDDWLQGLMRLANVGERLLGVAIVSSVAWFGLLQGIGVGLVAAGVAFVVRYSRVDPVRSVSDGSKLRSRVDRSPHEIERLRAAGDRLVVFELQGYLFFGSLTAFEDRVREVVDGPGGAETLLLDFANVTGVDSSGYSVIAGLLQELQAAGMVAWASSLDPWFCEVLLDYEPTLESQFELFDSLEDALEVAEDRLLASTLNEMLHPVTFDQATPSPPVLSPQLLAECVPYRFQADTVVMAEGAPSYGLLIVQRGRLSAFRVEPDGSRTRLRRFGEFTVVGEVGLLAGAPCTAEVVAEDIVDGWWLPIDRYHNLRIAKPWLIFELHEFIVRTQAERMNSLSAFAH